MEAYQCQLYLELPEQLTKSEKKWTERNFENGNSFWLTAKSSGRDKVWVSKNVLFDAMAQRYGLQLKRFHTKCEVAMNISMLSII